MALKPSTRYPAQTDTDAAYPHGKARNAGSFQDGTGTPLEKDWVNDQFGFQQALLTVAGIVPSGAPDTGIASQYLEAVQAIAATAAASAVAAAQAAARRLLIQPRKIVDFVLSPAGFLAPISVGFAGPVIIGSTHSGGVPLVWDGDISFGGVMASITGAVQGGAYDPVSGRAVVVGVGGNANAYSDNLGATWNAGGALGGSGLGLLWNPTYSRFIALYTNHARYSSNAVAWTDVTLTGATNSQLALLANGNVVTPTGAAPLAFSLTSNGGTSWGAGATLANASDFATKGCVAGAGLDYGYHCGLRTSDSKLQISRTLNGSSWSQVSELAAPAGLPFTGGQIRQCPDTGALFLLASASSPLFLLIYCSIDQGVTWSEPVLRGLAVNVAGWGVAQGKVFVSDNNIAGGLYVSDGIRSI